MHVAVSARTLHDRTRERELDDVEIGDVETSYQLARLLKEFCNRLASQRTLQLLENISRTAEYIDGDPEWSGILGADPQDLIAKPRHARSRRRPGERPAWDGRVPSHD